ncbi:hypothetical protein GCM10018777_08960 [Streptomyces albogriseolus]|nr:hypothetical protein GCM10018777_08960 [Streptomyces viridodiastaticus]
MVGRLQLEGQVFDVGEADFVQAASAAAAVLEVHLLEPFGHDLLELLVAGAGLLASKRRAACCGGRATVRCRMRDSSVDPIGTV